MNFILATYLGLVVAIFILVWAVVELTRRYVHMGRKSRAIKTSRISRIKRKDLDIWVPLVPDPADLLEDPFFHPTSTNQLKRDLQRRAKHNGQSRQSGYYSESHRHPWN